ncbi:MAG TPA: VanW family protein, partial [Euzebya sp.]|nr:VanW family protein [Euzebya sp.]
RPSANRRHAPGRRVGRKRWWLWPVTALIGVALLSGMALAGVRAIRPDALPGATLEGTNVGGMDAMALAAVAEDLASQRGARRLQVRHGSDTIVSTAGEIGYELDVEQTVEAVLHRGRQGNPLAAMRDHLDATVGTVPVAAVQSFDMTAFADWVDHIAADVGLPPVKGDVVVTGAEVEIIPPVGGATIDVHSLRTAALAALEYPATPVIDLPTTRTVPDVDPDRIAVLVTQVRQAISAPVVLTHGDVSITFSPTQIGHLLEVVAQPVSGRGGNAQLVLAIDPAGVTASITAAQFQGLHHDPSDATFSVSGQHVQLVPAVDGFRFDARMAATQLLEIATGEGPRTAELVGRLTPAAVSTEEIRDLGITELVATFTTDHPCCQGRVTNIQRIADLADGTIVQPGDTFSLNAVAGRRTPDNGFVDGGAISGGEFVDEVGGGVSQFTTTLFNAVFLAGYEIVEFRPHSYYISRYPEGREATLNFDPPIDLKFTNDSPHAIYLDTSYTDTSITVSLFSTTWARVETTTGPRYGFRPPEEQREETDELPVGEERVQQSGREGFSVDFTRELFYVDGRHEVEHYTTNYLPEPRIIEVGTGTEEEPSDEPEEPAEEATRPEATPTSQPTTQPTTPPPPPQPTPPTPDPTSSEVPADPA